MCPKFLIKQQKQQQQQQQQQQQKWFHETAIPSSSYNVYSRTNKSYLNFSKSQYF